MQRERLPNAMAIASQFEPAGLDCPCRCAGARFLAVVSSRRAKAGFARPGLLGLGRGFLRQVLLTHAVSLGQRQPVRERVSR